VHILSQSPGGNKKEVDGVGHACFEVDETASYAAGRSFSYQNLHQVTP
jgi:hypothetical protein